MGSIPYVLSDSLSSSNSAPAIAPSVNTAFSLGNVVFSLWEAPEELAFPATQALVSHDLIGGKRIIQALGTTWKPLRWEGILEGINAQYSARVLMRMMAEATVQRLTYLSFALDVVVEEFTPAFVHQNRCKYSITVQVLNDASGAVAYTVPRSVDAQIQSSVQDATQNLDPTDAQLAAAHQQATAALDAAGPAAQATGPVVNSTLASIQNVLAVGQQSLAALPPGTISAKSLALTRYLNDWSVIYKNFNGVQAHHTITQNGGSLFDVASQYYGDPSKAINIQQQNGFTSTELPSGVLTTIILPPLQSS